MLDTALNGTWRIVKSVASGVEGATPEGSYLLIRGEVFERHTPSYVFTRTISINAERTPHEIDLLITNEPDKGKVFLGIYSIEGDTLTLAHALPGRPRPTGFASTPDNQQILSVSVRQIGES
jgi:uncharacterized protein (TIGR03067 family)